MNNQQHIIQKRRRINQLLSGILLGLLTWTAVLVWAEWQRLQQQQQRSENATHIVIQRHNDTVELLKKQQQWQITAPYQDQASNAVVQALLTQLNSGCRTLSEPPSRQPQYFASLTVDDKPYQVGELNTASDQVYVSTGKQLQLCDKLLASIVLAPAINFINKQLYKGELTAIRGDFGELSDFSGIDLSVLEVAPADSRALPQDSLSTLRFIADKQSDYQAFLHQNGQHLLLFEPKKSVIYVIAANPKLNAILGL